VLSGWCAPPRAARARAIRALPRSVACAPHALARVARVQDSLTFDKIVGAGRPAFVRFDQEYPVEHALGGAGREQRAPAR